MKVDNSVQLPSGVRVPALGQGTWKMAEQPARRQGELAALRLGLDLGLTLVDTAEMYADGGAEELVGEAISNRRDGVFLVSKFYPHHATRKGVAAACERSLRRLKTDCLDLYLLHWRGSVPLAETFAGLIDLAEAGKIRAYGVSNFDVSDLKDILSAAPSATVATNQILYNLVRRGAEFDVLPWCRSRSIPLMAYSPVEQGRLLPRLQAMAARHGSTPAQIALAWLLRQPGLVAIPKAGTVTHVRENHGALDVQLSPADVKALDEAFPPPSGKQPLAML
ncbi:MAG TPA: aldo/keto reductase [Chthoniobacterales bacterium]